MEFITDNIFTCALNEKKDFCAIEGKALESNGYNFAVLHPCKVLGEKKYIIHAFTTFAKAKEDADTIMFKQFGTSIFYGVNKGKWEKVA